MRPQWKACPEGVPTAASRLEMFAWPTLRTKFLQILPVRLTLRRGAVRSTLSMALPGAHPSRQTQLIVRSPLPADGLTPFLQWVPKQKPHRNHITRAASKAKSSWGQIEFSWTASGAEFNLQLPKCLNYSYAWHNKDLVLAVVACLIHS